jgi:hypothetical protein
LFRGQGREVTVRAVVDSATACVTLEHFSTADRPKPQLNRTDFAQELRGMATSVRFVDQWNMTAVHDKCNQTMPLRHQQVIFGEWQAIERNYRCGM